MARSVEGDVVGEIKTRLPSIITLIERERTGPLHMGGTSLPDVLKSADVGQGDGKQ